MIRLVATSPNPLGSRKVYKHSLRSRSFWNWARGGKKVEDSSTTSSKSSSSKFIPSRVGVGEDSPRYPHLTCLPVTHRPVFPGILTTVNITDLRTIEAMEKVNKENGYIGAFLRTSAGSEGDHLNAFNVDGQHGKLVTPEIITDISELHKVGTFAQVHRVQRSMGKHSLFGETSKNLDPVNNLEADDDEDVSALVFLMAHRRIDLLSVDNIGPPIDITVRHWDKLIVDPSKREMLRALSNEILSTIREVAQLSPLFREHIHHYPSKVDANDPFRLADFAASITTANPDELQGVLEERDPEQRLHKSLTLLSKEREVSKLQQEIQAQVEEKMSETQRKYFLREQLKSIKKELGEEMDDKDALLAKYKKRLATFVSIPEEATKAIKSEMDKMASLEKNSSEYNLTKSYLDWLTSIPWGVTSEESFDLKAARDILDRYHYGMDDVKDTILQFIAVGKLKGSVQGKILCLSGPPGTGKTSIAKSVAHALGREFYRFSVGGLSDVSEIKGHRRTYIGAMPGKLIQCLKSTGTSNPLVLIDEIDKLGRGYQGDPASALLELLDPSQNSTFRDHYLDVPVDMSKVLFMCTANVLDTIPGPLLDRMEVIQLSGYDLPDKVEIAEKYLIPKAMKESGLMEHEDVNKCMDDKEDSDHVRVDDLVRSKNIPVDLSIDKSAVENLARWYCREAGVRNLEKHIQKISRKLALQLVAEEENTVLTEKSRRKSDSWKVSEVNLHEYVGKPLFTSDRMYEDELPHGIVMGLAWTSMGGSALYIETQGIARGGDNSSSPSPHNDKDTNQPRIGGGGTLKTTGQLGNVMSESTQIAYTVARARLQKYAPGNLYFDLNDVHMHVPEGATPKDGPSAGITMVTALLSLALDRPVRKDVAMTGEISLTGKVLPVGGIKEKIMAARRANITCIILPVENKRDWDECPGYLKEGLEIHFATDYQDVFKVAFAEEDSWF